MKRLKKEVWKPVVGWEGLYEVSDRGRVRSLDRVVTRNDGVVQNLAGKVLKQTPTTQDYRRVDLCRDGVRKGYEVHRLVAAAFLGPCPDRWQVMHANDIPHDNRLNNLSYGTQHENMRGMVERGRHYAANKTHCANGHEFNLENTELVAHGNGKTKRRCRKCRKETMRRYYEKRKRNNVIPPE